MLSRVFFLGGSVPCCGAELMCMSWLVVGIVLYGPRHAWPVVGGFLFREAVEGDRDDGELK
eukprot:79417-Amphidinium_carterae.1